MEVFGSPSTRIASAVVSRWPGAVARFLDQREDRSIEREPPELKTIFQRSAITGLCSSALVDDPVFRLLLIPLKSTDRRGCAPDCWEERALPGSAEAISLVGAHVLSPRSARSA